jgi:hypothetical protein
MGGGEERYGERESAMHAMRIRDGGGRREGDKGKRRR